jgi:hypothetical protein
LNYACSIWTSAAWSLIRELQVFQSKCLRIATVHLGTSVTGKFTRVWEFVFRRPHQSPDWQFRLKVRWCGKPGNSADICSDRGLTWPTWSASQGWCRLQSVAAAMAAQLTKRIVPSRHFSDTLTEGFPWFFLSCKANAREYLERRGTARNPPQAWRFHQSARPPRRRPFGRNYATLGSNPRKPSN